MEQIIYSDNPQGFRVKKCCMACRHKDLTRAKSLRRCTKHGYDVNPYHTCKDWEMSEVLKKVGA